MILLNFRGGGVTRKSAPEGDLKVGHLGFEQNVLKAKTAFTLAEVLITLGIIGIVAAMTLPSLIGRWKDKEYEVRAKRSYSLIMQAIERYKAESGVYDDLSGLFDTTKTSKQVTEEFSKYFTAPTLCLEWSERCVKYNHTLLYGSPIYKDGVTHSQYFGYPFFVANDGSLIRVEQYPECVRIITANETNPDGTVKKDDDGNPITYTYTDKRCANIFFSTNGPAGPNQAGADVFALYVMDDWSVVPAYDNTYGGKSFSSMLAGNGPIYTPYKAGVPYDK